MSYFIPFLFNVVLSVAPPIAGLVLIGTRVRGRARGFGLAGCILLIVSGLLGGIWNLVLPRIAQQLDVSLVALSGVSAVFGLISTIGLLLVIVAVVAGRGTGLAMPQWPAGPAQWGPSGRGAEAPSPPEQQPGGYQPGPYRPDQPPPQQPGGYQPGSYQP